MNEQNINNYFERVKQNPPILSQEKVHQIINSPQASARLKGNTFKPFKFILMTTLVTIITSIALLWPGSKEQKSNIINSDRTHVETQLPMAEGVEEIMQSPTRYEVHIVASDEDELESNLALSINTSTEKSETTSFPETGTQAQVLLTTKPILQPTLNENIDAPATKKGNLKMVVADKNLLTKLGFRFVDQSNFYQNQFDTLTVRYTHEVFERSEYIVRLNTHSRSENISSNNNYFPLIESYRSGKVVSYIHKFEDLKLTNDTLFPIYCPQGLVNNDPNDIIFWFNITEDFIAQLPEAYQKKAKEIQDLKYVKDQFPEINLIDYSAPLILDPSKFIELNNAEIFDFGFSIFLDTIKFRTVGKTKMLRYEWIINNTALKFDCSKSGTQTFKKYENNDEFKEKPELVYITNTMGDFKRKFSNSSLSERLNLIPILIAKDSMNLILDDVLDKPTDTWMDEDYVYWFSINDQLFNALPNWLSEELQAEYNYFIAKDKSAMLKPECNYFEECRNNLEVTDFNVFPNPASSRVTVVFNLPQNINGKISLVDLSGHEQQVLIPHTSFSTGSQQIEIDLLNVPEGIYLITLYSDAGIQSKRLIVTR